MTQQEVIDLIIQSEKGVNNQEPASVGGMSVDGISVVKYAELLPEVKQSIPDAPDKVENLVDRPDVVRECYRINLERAHVWELPDFLQYIYADFYTNGQSAAVRIIQGMAGVTADGVWGSITSQAVSHWKQYVAQALANDADVDNGLITRFHEEKLAHYQRLVDKDPEEYAGWHAGWKRRANHVLSKLQGYFEIEGPTPSAISADEIITETPPTLTGLGGNVGIASDAESLNQYTNAELIAELYRRHCKD